MIKEECGSCKGFIEVKNLKEMEIAKDWRYNHRCEGPQVTYLFQSNESAAYYEEPTDEA